MASSKDTFEGKTFASNTFASGTFRGLGAALAATIVGTWSQVIHAFCDQPRISVHSTTALPSTADSNERIEVDG